MPDAHCTKLNSCTSGELTNYAVISNKSWVLTEHTEDTSREHHELDCRRETLQTDSTQSNTSTELQVPTQSKVNHYRQT